MRPRVALWRASSTTPAARSGFLTIVGHGVAETLIDEARDAALRFFRLPLEEKLRTPRPSHESGRGYTAFCDQALAYSLGVETPPDLQESYGVGPLDELPDDSYYSAPEAWTFFVPNIWPAHPAEFRPALSRYFARIDVLSRRLMGLFALALGLDRRFFDDKVNRPVSSMRAVHYPPSRAAPRPGQLRAGAHSDYGSLTILQTDDDPGCLQVKTRRGDWIDVIPPPGAFVVNLGDLMSRWTNERWISTLHRVAIPPDGHDGSRLSLVFFRPAELRHRDRMPADVPGTRESAPLSSDQHRRALEVQAHEGALHGRRLRGRPPLVGKIRDHLDFEQTVRIREAGNLHDGSKQAVCRRRIPRRPDC